MFRNIAIALITLSMLIVPGLVPTAEAGHDQGYEQGYDNRGYSWLGFGAGFNIGGLQFNIGFRSGGARGGDYFVRAHDRIAYRGYECTDRCYRAKREYYHHDSCPVIRHYFENHGYRSGEIFAAYAPRVDGYRGDYRNRDDYRSNRGSRYGQDRRYDRGHWDRHGRNHDHDRCNRY